MYCTRLLEERNELHLAIASRLRGPLSHSILKVSLLLNAKEPLHEYLGPTAFDLLKAFEVTDYLFLKVKFDLEGLAAFKGEGGVTGLLQLLRFDDSSQICVAHTHHEEIAGIHFV